MLILYDLFIILFSYLLFIIFQLDTSIIPTQCCVVIIKVPEHSLFSTHSYSFINSVFANILAGKTEDPDFMMTTTLDYAPVMLTYNEYPAIQTS